MSYLKDRLKKLNITDKINSYKTFNEEGRAYTFKFFTETDKGDISINYIDLDGHEVAYKPEDSRKLRAFSRTRYQVPKELPDGKTMKYDQPPKTPVMMFVTPELLRRYKNGEETSTLYIVEGEFKAFSMSNFGLPTFGIGGIHNFKDEKKVNLNPEIIRFCEKCKVQDIILLFDADCLQIKWEEKKDLYLRPSGFYGALRNFNELLKPHNLNLYFAHVVQSSDYKGIDDVLYNGISDQKQVVRELEEYSLEAKEKKYVMSHLVTGVSYNKIRGWFGLNSVEEFFNIHKDFLFDDKTTLKDKDFVYNQNTYHVENGQVTLSWNGQQKQYVRIGINYFKKTFALMTNNQIEENLELWSKGAICDDFKKSKLFLDSIEKYDSFTNIPENDPDKYKRTIIVGRDGMVSKLYNRYSKVPHTPEEGSWQTINKLLHHIFNYTNLKGESLYEFGLDYLQLLYTQPLKHLPILCLVSKERGTGKSTFLDLLKSIFADNMRILDSSRLMSPYNGHWAGKLVVAVDESFINMDDKNGAGNKLKMIATNATIPFEEKHKNAGEIPNISKLIMCSNDEFNFVKIDKEENRYCIIKVEPFTGDTDPHMVKKMLEEIPAFLYFLKHRQLYYPERSRLWFDERLFETEALLKIQSRTEPLVVRHIKGTIKEQFYNMRAETLKLSARALFELVKPDYQFVTLIAVKEWLMDNGYRTGNPTNINYRFTLESSLTTQKGVRCYTFKIRDFLSAEELDEFYRQGCIVSDNVAIEKSLYGN